MLTITLFTIVSIDRSILFNICYVGHLNKILYTYNQYI